MLLLLGISAWFPLFTGAIHGNKDQRFWFVIALVVLMPVVAYVVWDASESVYAQRMRFEANSSLGNLRDASSTMTCRELKQLGPDVSVMQVIHQLFDWVQQPLPYFVNAMGVALICVCVNCVCSFRTWRERSRQIQSASDSAQAAAYQRGQRDFLQGLCDYLCAGFECIVDSMFAFVKLFWPALVVLGLLALGLCLFAMAIPVMLLLTFLFFPLCSKYKVYHLERDILLCVPMATSTVAFATPVLPAYTLKLLWGLHGAFKPKLESLENSNKTSWLAWQIINLYTDVSMLLTFPGHGVPKWIVIAWLLTVAVTLFIVAFGLYHVKKLTKGEGKLAFEVQMSDIEFYRCILGQFIFEDILQVVLVGLGFALPSLKHTVNEYAIYGFVANILQGISRGRQVCEERRALSRSKEPLLC